MTDVTIDIQRQIVNQERQLWVNTRFQLQARMKAVQGLITKTILKEEDKKPILDELTRVEAWIGEYDEQLAALDQSALADNPIETKVPANGHIK